MKKKIFAGMIILLFITVSVFFVTIINRIVYRESNILTIVIGGMGAFALILGVSIFGWWIDKDDNL